MKDDSGVLVFDFLRPILAQLGGKRLRLFSASAVSFGGGGSPIHLCKSSMRDLQHIPILAGNDFVLPNSQ